MNEKVDRAELLPGAVDDGGDLVVAGDVHRNQERGIGFRVGEQGDPAAVSLPLVVGPVGEVREPDAAALVEDFPGDRPGDRVVVGDAEHQAFESFEPAHAVFPRV
jgi:hypothetical protein